MAVKDGRFGRALAGVRRWWRSSLRVRVITSTLVVGVFLTSAIGAVLYQRIAEGLVVQAVNNAQADAASRVQRAQDLFNSTDRLDNLSLSSAAVENITDVAPGGAGDGRSVVLARAIDSDRDTLIAPVVGGDITAPAVPIELREALAAGQDAQQVYVHPIASRSEPDVEVPSVMVASRVSIPRAGPYDMILIYPMEREQAILDLVSRWFLVGGFLLLMLIGGVAWLATRLVTEPVGQAAAVSTDLARGDLDQRLPVRGTDELAQLGLAFNTMADNLQQQIVQLEHLSSLQQRFVSDVSHELRTPLTTIRMAGEMLHLSRGDFSAPVARSAELLYGELDRFEALLTELLEISRYDSGTSTLVAEEADAVALVHEVVDAVELLTRQSGSEVRISSTQSHISVEVDDRRIARILRNLIVNALEHGEGRPVDVRLCATDELVVISVRDRGVGLNPAEAEHVFERFWRADPARARTTGGTGLGLSIAREDARLHGGYLQVSGLKDQGACFRLILPRSQDIVIDDEPAAVPVDESQDLIPPQLTTTAAEGVL